METVSPIRPLYLPEEGSDLIELGEAPIEIRTAGETFQTLGRATVRVQPKFTLLITVDLAEGWIDLGPVDIRYGSSVGFGRASVLQVNRDFGKPSKAELVPNPERLVQGRDDHPLATLLFHVINFPRFFESGANSQSISHSTSSNGFVMLGRVVLVDSPWQIELQEMRETKAIAEKLRKTSGFGITHVGQLKRQDGKPFTAKEADEVLSDLHSFLGFANGAWSPPVLMVGFDAAGERVYEQWGSRICTPWEVHWRCFDTHHAEFLRALYPGFRTLLHDPAMGDAVRTALYWYLRSNRGGEGAGIDSGVILSQATLERLTIAYLEAQGAFVAKTAANLRETLSRLGIPTTIPKALTSLAKGASEAGWKDGPHAITSVRNELTHPKKRLPFKVGSVVYETWNLSQWYIELIILRLAGYDGEYGNRLVKRWAGQVEPVPWTV
jgi:hypothetical protein